MLRRRKVSKAEETEQIRNGLQSEIKWPEECYKNVTSEQRFTSSQEQAKVFGKRTFQAKGKEFIKR